jgi:hypothetical protein
MPSISFVAVEVLVDSRMTIVRIVVCCLPPGTLLDVTVVSKGIWLRVYQLENV